MAAARYPGSNNPDPIAFADLTVGSRVRFTRPQVLFPEDDGGLMRRMDVEGTITFVNPRGEVFLSDVIVTGGNDYDYPPDNRPIHNHLLEDATFGEWYWVITPLTTT